MEFDPVIIVHPQTYIGSSGPIEIDVCLSSSAPELEASLKWAVAKWNALKPTVNNCLPGRGGCLKADAALCQQPEPTPIQPDTYPCPPIFQSAKDTLLHELGHCVMGLGHNNWVKNNGAGDHTSFTATRNASSGTTTMNDGVDNVQGSRDDFPTPNPGSPLIHWFRRVDNDPFVIDSTVYDSSTYSRTIGSLPPPSRWPTSINVKTSALLGAGLTDSVMKSTTSPNSELTGLSPDEVDTVLFAASGLDPDLGQTSDDYSVQVVFVTACLNAEVQVEWHEYTDGTLGECDYTLEPISTGDPHIQHYRMKETAPNFHLLVTLDKTLEPGEVWRFLLFTDGFESGTFSEWSSVFP
ncbi:MAG: hypothetical protein ABI639_09165 [Thermoanaerobaculia bacterium]